MKLVVSLGNPGRKYMLNRHNIGFMIGEAIIQRYSIPVKTQKFSSFCGKGTLDDQEVVMLFPQTYMNNSGTAVKAALEFYRMEVNDLVVIHDEIELPFGELRLKIGGGHKGHNGIRSIMHEIVSGDFLRIRFGVGRPENPHVSVADYLLSDFFPEEKVEIQKRMPEVVEFVLECMRKV